MTVACKICRYTPRSEKAEPEADIIKKLAQHLGAAHKEHAADLAATLLTLQGLTSTFLVFGYMEIPEGERSLKESYRQNRIHLFAILEENPLAPRPAPAAVN